MPTNIQFNHFAKKFILNGELVTIKKIAKRIQNGETFYFTYTSDDGMNTQKGYVLNSQTIKAFLQF